MLQEVQIEKSNKEGWFSKTIGFVLEDHNLINTRNGRYRTKKFTILEVKKMLKDMHPSLHLKIVLVDNNSTDNTIIYDLEKNEGAIVWKNEYESHLFGYNHIRIGNTYEHFIIGRTDCDYGSDIPEKLVYVDVNELAFIDKVLNENMQSLWKLFPCC